MIILTQINFSEDHAEKILPLGILSVGSALKKRGFSVELVNINEDQIDEAAKKIVEKNPEFVGFSVITGAQTKHSAELSKKLKALKPDLPILWGGIHPSLLPLECLKEDYVDFLIQGEGEETTLEFAKALAKGGAGENYRFKNILGLGYKEKGQPIMNERRPLIENLGDWRIDFSLLNVNDYVYSLGKYKRVIAYKASRGCTVGCAFCYNNEFNQNRWRAWPVAAVIEDINFLKENYKIDAVKFYDDNFFVDKARAFEILEKIKLPSHLEIRIDFIDEEMARRLKEYEIFDLLIGLESGSDRILTMIDKNFTVSRMLKGVEAIAKNDLRATYSFIVGLPGETEDEFDETLRLMYKIYKIHPRAGFTLGAYLPYPGSKLYQTSLETGFQPPEKTEDWGSIDRFRKDFNSPWIDAKKVWVIRECYKIMSWDAKIFKKWFELRVKHNFFSIPLDIYLVEYLADKAISEKGFFGKGLRKVYNFLRR